MKQEISILPTGEYIGMDILMDKQVIDLSKKIQRKVVPLIWLQTTILIKITGSLISMTITSTMLETKNIRHMLHAIVWWQMFMKKMLLQGDKVTTYMKMTNISEILNK